jgi:hypothetical protein
MTVSRAQPFLERIYWSKGNAITTRSLLFVIFNVFKAKWMALEWRKAIEREIGWAQPEFGSIVTCQPLYQSEQVIPYFFCAANMQDDTKATWGNKLVSDCQVTCASSRLLSSFKKIITMSSPFSCDLTMCRICEKYSPGLQRFESMRTLRWEA